jgi:hypothetical protein
VMSWASMTCHSRWMSAGFGLYVRTVIAPYFVGVILLGRPRARFRGMHIQTLGQTLAATEGV